MNEPYWAPRARELSAAGLTHFRIGQIVGRTKSRVRFVLSGKPPRNNGPSGAPRTVEQAFRAKMRRVARERVAETGEPLEAVYAEFGVPSLDKARAWDRRSVARDILMVMSAPKRRSPPQPRMAQP